MRRATRAACGRTASFWHFYPRSPCGERPHRPCWPIFTSTISIHALLAESDQRRGGAFPPSGISIHALLAESDRNHAVHDQAVRDFYPRSPCGERPVIAVCEAWAKDFYPRSPCGERRQHRVRRRRRDGFLSTLSLRRATGSPGVRRQSRGISIHALLAESDKYAATLVFACLEFLSTLSLRRATQRRLPDSTHQRISIHALLAESDASAPQYRATYGISIHALLAESDWRQATAVVQLPAFLSTLSLRRATL